MLSPPRLIGINSGVLHHFLNGQPGLVLSDHESNGRNLMKNKRVTQ
jgi:hypothetical protein